MQVFERSLNIFEILGIQAFRFFYLSSVKTIHHPNRMIEELLYRRSFYIFLYFGVFLLLNYNVIFSSIRCMWSASFIHSNFLLPKRFSNSFLYLNKSRNYIPKIISPLFSICFSITVWGPKFVIFLSTRRHLPWVNS